MAIAGALAFIFGFLMSLRSAPAQDRFDFKVRNDFFAGFAGNRDALDRALKACEETLASNPKNAEALVWHGSGLYYLGGQAYQAGDMSKGQELVTKGIGEMDQAIAMAPDHIGVRIPRGAVLLQSTLFMQGNPMAKSLIEKGLSDYERALELQEPALAQLGTHPKGELLFGIADAHRRLGHDAQAQQMFERISSELKGSVYAKRADTFLSTKTLTPQQAQCVGCHTQGK